MKIHENTDTGNFNIYCLPQNSIKTSFTSWSGQNLTIKLHSPDRGGNDLETTISLANVLILGNDAKYNQELAMLLEESFERLASKPEIVDYNEFLLFSSEEKNSDEYIYIITCDNDELSAKNLNILTKNTSTQILFRINGLRKRLGGSGVYLSQSAILITKALGIESENRAALGLLASIRNKEFCIHNKQGITKRRL